MSSAPTTPSAHPRSVPTPGLALAPPRALRNESAAMGSEPVIARNPADPGNRSAARGTSELPPPAPPSVRRAAFLPRPRLLPLDGVVRVVARRGGGAPLPAPAALAAVDTTGASYALRGRLLVGVDAGGVLPGGTLRLMRSRPPALSRVNSGLVKIRHSPCFCEELPPHAARQSRRAFEQFMPRQLATNL